MTSFVAPIDVQNIVRDLRKLVVNLKENEKVSQSLTYANRVADIIQRRGGDAATRHIPGQDFEKEHKIIRNRQLRDLEKENRELRQLYEDSQWTLHLVMDAHRKLVYSHFGEDNEIHTPKKEREVDENVVDEFRVKAVWMVIQVNDVFEYQAMMHRDVLRRIYYVTIENNLLRSIFEMEAGLDRETILSRLKQSNPVPLVSPEDRFESFSERNDSAGKCEESTLKKDRECDSFRIFSERNDPADRGEESASMEDKQCD